MIDHLPDRLDLFAMAEAGRELRGQISLADLERVLPLLTSDDGSLDVELKVGKSQDGTRYLSGTIKGSVMVRCERCLEPMVQTLDQDFMLGLVHDQEAGLALSKQYEALLITGEPTRIADVVSDEVLLALPIVSTHAELKDCRDTGTEYAASASEKGDNPFAVLEQLKQKH